MTPKASSERYGRSHNADDLAQQSGIEAWSNPDHRITYDNIDVGSWRWRSRTDDDLNKTLGRRS